MWCTQRTDSNVSRWIKSTQRRSDVTLSDYLTKAAGMTNDQIQVLLAIDLSDLAEPHELDEKVRESELFKKAKLAPEQVVPLLASLQGAMLRLAIDKEVQAELRIDFAKDVTPLKAVAKELVLNAVGDLGIEVVEMANWEAKVAGKEIRMMGKLSQDGQRRIFSIVELPPRNSACSRTNKNRRAALRKAKCERVRWSTIAPSTRCLRT